MQGGRRGLEKNGAAMATGLKDEDIALTPVLLWIPRSSPWDKDLITNCLFKE